MTLIDGYIFGRRTDGPTDAKTCRVQTTELLAAKQLEICLFCTVFCNISYVLKNVQYQLRLELEELAFEVELTACCWALMQWKVKDPKPTGTK